jgi:tetratricopeptide (TPR) repeat protein
MRDLLMFGRRLPFIIYLVSRLGMRTLPIPLRVGRDMDWPIARLFAIAADWLDRAGVILRRLGDEDGMGQVEENLAQLYLSLGHFRRAKAIYRRLLAPEGVSLSEYRAARARLGLAQALVYQGQLTQARELLGQILPVFVTYQHPLRIAQTHTALAQTYALERQTDRATVHYQRAIQLYHQLNDEGNTTEVVEQMLLLRERPQTDEATRQSIETTASQVTHRRYQTRFNLPALNWFRAVALGSLAAVFLFSLLIFVRIESGTGLHVSEVSLSRQTDVTALFIEPAIPMPEFTPQLESSFEVNSSALLIVVAIVVYLVFYTVYGLWITVRTPLRTLQEGQRLDIVATPHGLSRGVEGVPGSSKIKWEQVAALLSSDRSLLRKPISVFFSRFALVGERGAIVVDGRTRRYLAARDFVQQRLRQSTRLDGQPVTTCRFGFSLFYSYNGRLLIITLAFILACIVTAVLAPQTLATRLGPLPYSLADLYSISYLGLLFPACWWLAVQPLRQRLFLKPDTHSVWLTGLVGLLLIVLGFSVMDWLRSLHLPNVAAGMGLSGAFLTGVAAYYVWCVRHWERMPLRQGERVYALPVRLAVLVAALALVALALGFVGRAAGARHYLTLANINWQRAADMHAVEDQARAQELYEEALYLYDRALEWGDDTASSHHSRGAILIQLGRYAEAIEPLQKALARGPVKTAYYNSLATAYSKQARVNQESDDKEEALKYYELARDNYSLALKRMREDSDGLVNVYLSRAGESSQIGEYYYHNKDVEGHWSLAQENYEAAHADYARALELESNNVAALSGRGWTAYKLSQFETDPEQKSSRLAHALGDLKRVTLVDPQQLFAWLGMSYVHFAIGETFAWQDEETGDIKSPCVDSPDNHSTYEQKLAYKEENLKAIEALERVAALAPDNASLSTMQGRIYYNLLNCPDMGAEQMYMAAIKLGPTLAVWPWGLAEYYRVQGELDKAIPYYVRAVELEPTNYRWQANLGWWAYVSGDYQIAIEASQAAVALNAAEPIPIFNWGLALVAMGDAESAWQVYQDGIVATDVLTDAQAALYRYDMARDDLENVAQDPAGVADALRAHLTFKEALVYLKAGSADEAQLAYQTGIAIAATLSAQELRRTLYDQAIDDLRAVSLVEWRAVDTAPDLVAALIEQLEAARGE